MTIIVNSADAGAGKIGYKNLLTTTGVTVTASSEASGFEKEKAYDYFGYDWWKATANGDSWLRASFGAAKLANYMAVWGHDLGTQGASVKPQYSTDGGSSWIDAASAVSPSDDSTIFFSFADINGADWRAFINSPSGVPVIAGVQIGEALTFPHNMEVGFVPPSLTPIIKLKTARTESGAFLGGSKLSEGIEGRFSFTNLDPVWIRSTWQPFVDHVQTPKPFVFAWDYDTHSSEVVLAWVTERVPPARYSTSLYMSISLKFEGTQ